MTNHRIRVLVAGDVYANRELVRPFLEDDGYEVAGEAFERADLVPEVIRQRPDAVVIDAAMLAGRRNGRTLQRVRRAAPDAKLVVLTATPGAAAFAHADATLESGLSLAALTSLLGRLFAEDAASAPVVGIGASAGVGAAAGVGATTSRAAPTAGVSEPRGSVARFVASVGLPLVIVWSLIALMTTGGGSVLPRADTTDLAAGGVVLIPTTDGPLQGAQDSLDRLLHAIRAGNPVLATVHAQALMDARASAKTLGYPIAGLHSDVESGLSAVVGLLSPGATGALSTILGGLFPQIEGDSGSDPGGGSGLILGSAAPSTTGTGTIDTSGIGRAGDGDDQQGNGNGGDRHRNEGDGDDGFAALGPGDGREWGQSHKLSKGTGGGPPPWAHGNGGEQHGSDDAPGHAPDHPGHAYGHDKHAGNGKHKNR